MVDHKMTANNSGGTAMEHPNKIGTDETNSTAMELAADDKISTFENVMISEEKPRTFTVVDMILGLGLLVLGYFFIRFTMFSLTDYYGWSDESYTDCIRIGTGVGLTVFTICYVVSAEWYARKKSIVLCKIAAKESTAWLLLLLLQAAAYLIIPRGTQTFFFLAGLFVTAVYWTMVRYHAISNELTSDYVLYDFFEGILFCLPGHFFDRDKAIVSQIRGKKDTHPLGQIVIGILCAVPVLAIAYGLLCQIDSSFGTLISLDQIFSYLGDGITTSIVTLFFGYFVANYIFALFYRSTEKYHAKKKESTIVECSERYGFLSMTSIATICILVLGLYLLFFGMQARYLFLAFSNQLPTEFTYAEYARRGFFELCAICVLNVSLLLTCHLFCKQMNKKRMKGLTLGIYSCSILFLIIAFRKMVLYITTYGLTQKRIMTCWFMILVAVIILIGIVREFVRFPMLRYIAFFAAFWFTALSLTNVDGLIAKNQFYLYQNGKIETLDYDLLDQCQLSALPYIEDQILIEGDAKTVQKLSKVANNIRTQYQKETEWWKYTTARRYLR